MVSLSSADRAGGAEMRPAAGWLLAFGLLMCGCGGGGGGSSSAPTVLTPPVIRQGPASQAVTPGTSILFSVVADGTAPLEYQWLRQGSDLPGATGTSYALTAAKTDAGASFTVRVRNSSGTVTSPPAVLTVQWAPSLTNDLPPTASAVVGQNLTLTVAADAQPAAVITWTRNGAAHAGGAGGALSLLPSLADHGAVYAATATNSLGSVSSRACTLSVSHAATDIPLTTRPHMDTATQRIYDRIRATRGWLLGVDALGTSANPFVTVPASQVSARWAELYPGMGQPACIEWEMGERNAPSVVRDWTSLKAFAASGGLPWIMLSMNNFTVPFGGGTPPQGGMNDTTNHAAGVLPGGVGHSAFDAFVRQLALEVKAAGVPVVFRPLHEGNGGWFWWGGHATDFKALWRFLFQRFQEAGAHNVIWCWAASDLCSGTDCNAGLFYPGDDVVDVLAVDLYFDAASLTSRATGTLAVLGSLGPDKPILLGEFGPKARADYWTQAASELATIPRFRGFSFWLARGWKPWGGGAMDGSLVDGTTDAATRASFLGFLGDPRLLKLGW